MTLTVRKWSLIAERTALCPVLRVVIAAVTMKRRSVVMRETVFAASGKILSVFAGVRSAGAAVTAEGWPLITGKAAIGPIPGAVIAVVTLKRRSVVMGETALAASGEVLPVFAGVGSAGTAVTAEGRSLITGKAAIGPIPGAVIAAVTMERRPVVMGETALAASGEILPVFAGVRSAGAAVTAEGRSLITERAAI